MRLGLEVTDRVIAMVLAVSRIVLPEAQLVGFVKRLVQYLAQGNSFAQFVTSFVELVCGKNTDGSSSPVKKIGSSKVSSPVKSASKKQTSSPLKAISPVKKLNIV